ncbi:hypothetical protein ACHAWF_018193 [Thalassiosira exigua]
MSQARRLIASTGVPRHITDAVMELAAEGLYPHIPDYDDATREALRQQRKVGVHLFMRGFVVKAWRASLKEAKVKEPERKVMAILHAL